MAPYDETTYELAQQLWDKAAGQLRASGFEVPDRKPAQVPDPPQTARPPATASASPEQQQDTQDHDGDLFVPTLVVSGDGKRIVIPVIDDDGPAGWTVLREGAQLHTFEVDQSPPVDAEVHNVLVGFDLDDVTVRVERSTDADTARHGVVLFKNKYAAMRHAGIVAGGDAEVRVAGSPADAASRRAGHRRVQKPAD